MSGRWTEQAIDVAPELTIEPVKTYYERRAVGYEFVRTVLQCSLRLM